MKASMDEGGQEAFDPNGEMGPSQRLHYGPWAPFPAIGKVALPYPKHDVLVSLSSTLSFFFAASTYMCIRYLN